MSSGLPDWCITHDQPWGHHVGVCELGVRPDRLAEWSGVPLVPTDPPLVSRVFRPVRQAIEALRRGRRQ